MFVRLRVLKRTRRNQFQLTLDVVDPGREAWDAGDCVVRIDLDDFPSHRCRPRGPLEPALSLYQLSRDQPPASVESRLLWEMGRAVDRYVKRLFEAEIICPFDGEGKDEPAERPDDPRG